MKIFSCFHCYFFVCLFVVVVGFVVVGLFQIFFILYPRQYVNQAERKFHPHINTHECISNVWLVRFMMVVFVFVCLFVCCKYSLSFWRIAFICVNVFLMNRWKFSKISCFPIKNCRFYQQFRFAHSLFFSDFGISYRNWWKIIQQKISFVHISLGPISLFWFVSYSAAPDDGFECCHIFERLFFCLRLSLLYFAHILSSLIVLELVIFMCAQR